MAIRCIQPDGDLFADLVPLLVTLREFAQEARKTNSWLLVDYLVKLAVQQGCATDSVRELLEQGRSLLLLDGLDEVPPEDWEFVLEAIQGLRYTRNRIVITCRTQGHGITNPLWDAFTRVEVADFTPEQANRFIAKWFQTAVPTAEISLMKDLQRQLREQKKQAISELTVTPLLVSLICAVFRDNQGTLPQRRWELYAKGMRLLLERLQRSPIDSRLTPDKKQEFLATLALKLFEDNNYFPNEKTLVAVIKSYFQVDSTTARCILKAFETETGLLIERSAGYWSFSHLTFQEYFAASAIVETTSVTSLKTLATHITEPRWREIFLLTTGMLQSTDNLLWLMKRQIDKLLVGDEKLQQFLTWIDKKARSIDAHHKLASIRTFYFSCAFTRTSTLDRACSNTLEIALDRSLLRALELLPTYATEHIFIGVPARAVALDLARALELNHELEKVGRDNPELKLQLKSLYDQLPNLQESWEARKKWLQVNGQRWREQLCAVMIEHCNIGHDWQFSNLQRQKLQQYDDANKLLVDCLNSDCYVSRRVREEIEDTLLLPMSELERRSPSS